MITLKCFKEYQPHELSPLSESIHLETEDGKDWYYHNQFFSPDTMKVCYGVDGIIRSFDKRAEYLHPMGWSVSEVLMENVPEDLDINGGFIYQDGKILVNQDWHIKKFNILIDAELKWVATSVTRIEEDVEDGVATNATETLANLRDYRVYLKKLDKTKSVKLRERPKA